MSKKRRYQIVLSAVLCMIMVTGCGRGKQLSDSDQGLYYANQEGTALSKKNIRQQAVQRKRRLKMF